MAKRIPPNLRDIKGLLFLTVDDLKLVEEAASSLSIDQCFDLLMIEEGEVPADEAILFRKVHKRGRAKGVTTAVEKLFIHMTTRQGGASAIEYLQKMSGEFAVNVESAKKGTGFSFNVIIPEDKKS